MKIKKTILFIFLAALLLASSSYAQVNDMMQRANQLYQEEQIEEAIKAYKDILNRGYVSDALYYNLGNSYFRIGQLGYSILYYEKGLKISPNDEDINYNLSIVKARTVDRIEEVPKLFIVEWWELLITSISITAWSLIVIFLFILFLLFLALYFTSKTGKMQRFGFLFGSINFAFLLVAVILLISSVDREMSTDFGVLVEVEAAAKQSPDDRSNDVFVIHEGLKFQVEDKVNNWSKIRLSDGKIGWLPNYSFEII